MVPKDIIVKTMPVRLSKKTFGFSKTHEEGGYNLFTVPIFAIDRGNLKEIPQKPIELEKDIQSLVERNLQTVFGYEFITS
ncbi:MAG: hypothetical protein ACRD5J_07105, partial [Nitrososphaeraceae archaeon]